MGTLVRGSGPPSRPPEGSAPEAAAPQALVGARIGNFLVESLLGEGAMGAVYIGVHDTLARRVAIKVIHAHLATDANLVERFIDEARAISGLGHPGLVQVHDFGLLPDGRQYSMMELLDGEDLEHLLRRERRLSPARAARLGAQVADALAAAHARGIIHRDLKSANLFVVRPEAGGGEEQVKVLDFGIAKLLRPIEEGGVGRTMAGTIVGTPLYMSPEQAFGQEVDGRTDMYALGVVLYELLAGRLPFTGENHLELLYAQAHELPPSLLQVAPDVPPALAEIVMRCLQKKREDRYPDMATVATALRAAFEGSLARGTAPGGGASTMQLAALPTGKRSSHKPWMILGGVVAIAAGTAVALSGGGGKSGAGGTAAAVAGGAGGIVAGGARGADAGGAGTGAGATVASDAGGEASADLMEAPPVASKNPYKADDAPAIAAGAAIWASECARCHGDRGEGDGKETPAGLEPRSFADLHAVPGLLDVYRFEIVRRGIREDGKASMPSFAATLTEDDTWKVVTFVATLAAPMPQTVDAMKPKEPKPDFDDALRARGATLFRKKCASCHGGKGRGNGPAAEYLGRFPADLTRGQYKLRSTPRDGLPTSEDIFRTITRGMGVGGMPAFLRLPERDRWALVAFVETLSPKFAAAAKKNEPVELVPLPPRPRPDPGARERGQQAFEAAGCVKCHGPGGRGDGPKAAALVDSRGHRVKPADLSSPRLLIGGATPEDIYRTMMTGVAGTPMPQGADFFDEGSEAWDVVEYILSLQRR